MVVQIGQNGGREPIDPSQQVVHRDHLIEAKLVKELPLISVLSSHHRRLSCRLLKQESLFARLLKLLFRQHRSSAAISGRRDPCPLLPQKHTSACTVCPPPDVTFFVVAT